MHIHRAEKAWLAFGIAALIVFLALIGFEDLSAGIEPPSRVQTIDPTKVAATAPFDRPGIRRVARDESEAYIVGRIFSFSPSTMGVPLGTRVTFYATSTDVVHGFFITNTDVNMMLVPGWVSSASHRFTRRGTYLLLCNEYCGTGHHFMYGTIEVK